MPGRPAHLAFVFCGLAAAITLSLSGTAARAADPPPLDSSDSKDDLVRGALADSELTADEPRTYYFVADGPGVLTVVWTQHNQAFNCKIIGPKDERYDTQKDDKLLGEGVKYIRRIILPVEHAGRYRVVLKARKTTKLRIGCAWMPFEQIAQAEEEAHDDSAPARFDVRHDWIDGLKQLPIGTVGEASNGSGIPRSYKHAAEGPGLLTIAVRAKPSSNPEHPTDITLQVNDDRGQSLTNGASDINYGGDKGAEHLAVGIRRAGSVQVVIHPLGGGDYWYAGSWIAIDELAAKKPE